MYTPFRMEGHRDHHLLQEQRLAVSAGQVLPQVVNMTAEEQLLPAENLIGDQATSYHQP